jgi:hypothetical protein
MNQEYESLLDGEARASAARIASRAADLMVQHEDASVTACIVMATLEESLLYGNLYELKDAAAPRGILGVHPFESLRRRGQP